MSKRISKKIPENITMIQFEEALSLYAQSTVKESEILSRIEVETVRIKEKYSDELRYLQTRKDNSIEILATYCKEQKDVLFNKRRSFITAYGTLGFRLCTPKLKTTKGNTWATVMRKVKEKMPGYIRTTEELAKDMLLADRTNEKVAPLLNEIGVHVVQDEAFFIELRKSVA